MATKPTKNIPVDELMVFFFFFKMSFTDRQLKNLCWIFFFDIHFIYTFGKCLHKKTKKTEQNKTQHNAFKNASRKIYVYIFPHLLHLPRLALFKKTVMLKGFKRDLEASECACVRGKRKNDRK